MNVTTLEETNQKSAVWCEIVTDFNRLEELSPEWQRLTHCDCGAEVFHSWAWARASWRAYGRALSLCTPVVHQGNHMIGILPLVRRGDTIDFLGFPDSDYNDLLCEEDKAAKVLEVALDSLLRLSLQWSSCTLDNLPAHSRIVRHLRDLPPRLRRHVQLTFQYSSPTIKLNENKEEVIGKLVKTKGLKRNYNKLRRIGQLTFRHIETRNEAREHLRHFFEQHITRFALNGLRSQFLEPERCKFYEGLIEELDPCAELRFAVLELDGRPVAYHLGFHQNGKFIHYKPTFDVNYWDCSPGYVLLLYLFQYALKSTMTEFDFSIGDHSYKQRFANHIKHNYALCLERHPKQLKSRFRRLVRLARQTVRSKPGLKNALKCNSRRLQEVLSYVTRFIRGEDLLHHCRNGVRTAYHKTIWARDEVFLFSRYLQTVGKTCDVDIPAGNLDNLARLSLEYPEFLNADKLQDYRTRLKQGDRVFIARSSGDGVSIFWIGQRNEISIPEIGRECTISLSTPAFVIDEGWTSPRFRTREAPPEVLRALVRQCAGMETWVYCLHSQPGMRRAIEGAGFKLRHRVVHSAFLHWFRRTWISPPIEMSSSEQETVEVGASCQAANISRNV